MRLKSFYAKTMTEAMQMVRHTLGEDAIIVATREENGGRTVRVTAAIEQADVYERSAAGGPHFEIDTVDRPAPARDWLQYDSEDEEGAVAEELTDVMLRHSAPEDITDQVISCATVLGEPDAGIALTAALEHLFPFRPLNRKPSATACMLIGPPGAGKTLAVAKLAARAVMDGLRVAVISTDTVRAGGIEQLSAFTKLLHVDLKKASDAKSLRDRLEEVRGADQIYVDTSGMNPFDPEEMRSLARLMAAGDVEPVMVLPAALDAGESGEMARAYAALGARSLLPTRIDIARRLGGILSAAHHGGLILTDASHTPKVADGLVPLSPERMAQLLMPRAAAKPKTRNGMI